MCLWQIIESGPKSPEWNMAVDTQRLQEFSCRDQAQLRFYEWNLPSATYGYFTAPDKFLCPEGLQKTGLKIARRPTGGGIIFHTHDLAFSLIVPSTHPFYAVNPLHSYQMINNCVLNAIQSLQISPKGALLAHCAEECGAPFCMAKPTIYDVMLDGRKVGGAAQRRTKHALLHQGSICINLPPKEFLERVLLPHKGLIQAMQRWSFPLLFEGQDERALRQTIRQRLIEQLTVS